LSEGKPKRNTIILLTEHVLRRIHDYTFRPKYLLCNILDPKSSKNVIPKNSNDLF